jgi:predicted dehydrogenase
MKKILLIGLGSIGNKHLSILEKDVTLVLAALRTNKGENNKKSKITEFFNLDDALAFDPHGVIITNPTSLHIQSAAPFLKIGCKVLIEKPISHTADDSAQLAIYANQIRVAYCLRFLGLYQKLYNIFQLEMPFKLSFKRSFYLPKWHPYADYRKEYTAQKDLGGGVIRTLSHEIDLALQWFGVPQQVHGLVDKLSSLEIDTDDYAFFSIKTKSGVRISYELDFFSPININSGEAYTQQGRYSWTMEGIKFCSYDSSTENYIFQSDENHLNEMYELQIQDFLEFIESDTSENATFKDSIEVIKLIERIEKR